MRISDWSSDVCSSDLGSSQQIIDLLLGDAAAAGVTLQAEVDVASVEKKGGRFRLTTNRGTCDGASLVVATGGPSIPKMGASGFAYDLARQFGLGVVPPRPALVPFTFDAAVLEKLRPLSGVSTEAVVGCGKSSFREALLFTHRGLSGPAILQISRSEEHTSELQSLMRISYAVFCLKKKTKKHEPKPTKNN